MESGVGVRWVAAGVLLFAAAGASAEGQLNKGKPMDRAQGYQPLTPENPLGGNVVPVHDPAMTRRPDGMYMVWSTDVLFMRGAGFIEQRCSKDLAEWHGCGYVFEGLPDWVHERYPSSRGVWAPDVSYFGGLYHLYYAVSTLGSQHSAIGMATNTTLDAGVPGYGWKDEGVVLQSEPGDDFNAIDPNVVVATGKDGRQEAWLQYGSYWSGIYQQELDPGTGRLVGDKRYHLAQQPTDRRGALEGSAILAHGGWYYLFASVGLCCERSIDDDTYQEIVGRSHNIHGPFKDQKGKKLLQGGGTVLLSGDEHWAGPGGGSPWQDADTTLFTFHALKRSEDGAMNLWVEHVRWADDWPLLEP